MIVIRDSREKEGHGYYRHNPVMHLVAGDYVLGEKYEDEIVPRYDLVIVERKQHGSELAQNLAKHRARFLREMDRMKKARYKFLVIEDSLENVLKPAFSQVNSNFLLSSILDLYFEYNVIPIFAGDKIQAEKFVNKLFDKVIKKESGPGLTSKYYRSLDLEDQSDTKGDLS